MPEKHFSTLSDLYLSAYLMYRGCFLESRTKDERGRVSFTFSSSEPIEDLIAQFRSKKPLSVVPQELFHALRDLKALLYE